MISKHRDGALTLFHRGDSPNIFCRIKLEGRPLVTVSTRTSIVEKALKTAEEKYIELTVLKERGLSFQRSAFRQIAGMYLDAIEADIPLSKRPDRRAGNLKDYKAIVDRYLIPYFGDRQIDTISNRQIADDTQWRDQYWIDGPGADQDFIEYTRGNKRV